ncbi:Ethr (predicted) [Pycnogonum litorale]
MNSTLLWNDFGTNGSSLTSTGSDVNWTSCNSTCGGDEEGPSFPYYLRVTVTVCCALTLLVGTCGNLLVLMVVYSNREMRNSTNIFLVNLSVADLLILMTCVPTALVEVHTPPETWVLGRTMCKVVPFVESTVCHGSVMTILAISFERFYAICHPLKAAYTCTKTRAITVTVALWIWTVAITSPILLFTSYGHTIYVDGTTVPVCLTGVHTTSRIVYFTVTTVLLFVVPFPVLVVLYVLITRRLICRRPMLMVSYSRSSSSLKRRRSSSKSDIGMTARRQVISMLIAVAICFFACLLPIRIFYIWYILSPKEQVQRIGLHTYYNILYGCRILLFVNSTINPLFYNAISSKFRQGFRKQLICECSIDGNGSRPTVIARKSTYTISMTTFSSAKTKSVLPI